MCDFPTSTTCCPTLMESCSADWCTAYGVIADVLAEVEDPSVDMRSTDNFSLLLEKSAGWTQDVSSIDFRLVEA